MSKDKTTPEATEEATPHTGTEELGTPGAEPNAGAEESSEERIERLEREAAEAVTLRKRLADHEAEVTRQQQTTAELRRRNEQYEEWIRQRQEETKAREDPSLRALARLREASAAFDAEGVANATQELVDLKMAAAMERAVNGSVSKSLEAFKLQKTIEELGSDFGEIDGASIARRLDSMSAADRVRSALLFDAEASGKLPEIISKREERRRAEAARAAAVNGLLGQGSAGPVPGNPSGSGRTVPAVNWQLLNEETRKRLSAAGYKPEPLTQG